MLKLIGFVFVNLFLSPVFANEQVVKTPAWFKQISQALFNFVFTQVTLFGVTFPWIVVVLVCAGLFFTLYFNFINIRGLKKALFCLKMKSNDKQSEGQVTHFQALTAAISGTVGIGNIGGVAVAISLGGPGAAFWIIVGGFLGMSVKFVECTLGVMYRVKYKNGTVAGGPMYYLKQGLKDSYFKRLGVVLGTLYAFFLIFASLGAGNMFQANQLYEQLVVVTGGSHSVLLGKAWLVGVGVASLVGIVIIGGIERIVKLTEKIVPFMAILYIIIASLVLSLHVHTIPLALQAILHDAFLPSAIKGGMLGVFIIGMQRAFFSNEAGIGSSSIAHSAVKTNEPLSQGFVAMLEPLIDTVIVCTLTALVIITVAIEYPSVLSLNQGIQGVALTSKAFGIYSSFLPKLLAMAVVFFAFSTIISWSYYGLNAWTAMVGFGTYKQRSFQFLFCCCIVVGMTSSLSDVINFSDACFFILAIPNLLGCFLMASRVKKRLAVFMNEPDGQVVFND